MINFECDYTEGAHASILQRLAETNMEQTPGYGKDRHCENARQIIRRVCNAPDADVHFLVGGTQTNKTVIASILRPYQGVICVETGHIAVHETGAIESTGHKVITVPGINGKITPQLIEQVYRRHFDDKGLEHCVQPGMVYISQSTEVGTVYHLNELEAISAMCRKLELPLFLDGARLGYGLAASDNDTSLADIARLCDVFYIGGTKIGALFGEAVVINNPSITPGFRYMIKQNGGLLAKGRLLGIQFETLFENDLYMQLSRHAVEQAMRIRCALEAKGVALALSAVQHCCSMISDGICPSVRQFRILATKRFLIVSSREMERQRQDIFVFQRQRRWQRSCANIFELLELKDTKLKTKLMSTNCLVV